MLAFEEQPLWLNALIFLLGASAVWFAGTKLSAYVDLIAERTGIGQAVAGALLLGGATSLPELATTLTASLSGAATLAGTNLLGGVVMQVAVLAIVDALAIRGKPLTLFSPRSSILLAGILLAGLTALASAAATGGEIYQLAGIGLFPILLFAAYVLSMVVIHRYEGQPRWEPAGEIAQPPESARDLKDAHHSKYQQNSTRVIGGFFAAAAGLVLVGGFFVAKSGEAIALQSGIGQSFVGATLVAFATSLPEVSTTWSAVRFGAYSMATANILGTNSLEIALFLPADVAYRDGAIFNQLDASSAFLGCLGVVVTCLYLWGILERRDRTILNMGYDSFAVLIVYVLGLLWYYNL